MLGRKWVYFLHWEYDIEYNFLQAFSTNFLPIIYVHFLLVQIYNMRMNTKIKKKKWEMLSLLVVFLVVVIILVMLWYIIDKLSKFKTRLLHFRANIFRLISYLQNKNCPN